jgi:SAM-dependent methyltransferase
MNASEAWAVPQAYESMMGRWSRRLAPLLAEFAGVESGEKVLDIGCGTGSLTGALLEKDARATSLDQSASFAGYTRERFSQRASVLRGDAQALPFLDGSFDRVVSQLVFNFVPDIPRAVREAMRVVVPGGVVSVAVWDYDEGMEMLKFFWDAAARFDPGAAKFHEGSMPLRRPGGLRDQWLGAGYQDVEERPLWIETPFADFDDYWKPFLGGIGPVGTYLRGLSDERREEIREFVRAQLPSGPLAMRARAWAVRGKKRNPGS